MEWFWNTLMVVAALAVCYAVLAIVVSLWIAVRRRRIMKHIEKMRDEMASKFKML